jgi:hypothetical protein
MLMELLTVESGSAQRKTCYSALGLSQILTWTDQGLKVGVHGEWLVFDCLSLGTISK